MAIKDDKVVDSVRTNSIKQELFPYVYNDGIHALKNTSTGSLYVGNGLAQLYKYLDLEASNVVTGWTPAPEDVGLSTDTVQHFLFHIQDYVFDNFSRLVNKYGAINANNYDKCLALLNQSETYFYLDYESYFKVDGKNKHNHKVLKDPLLPQMFTTDKAGKLCYDYSIATDTDADIYIHQFYLAIVPHVTFSTMGCRIDADMEVQVINDKGA